MLDPASPRFTDAERAGLRAQLMRRGLGLATKLAEVLAGKDGERGLAALGLQAKPGMRPEEVLKAALDHVEQLRRWLDASDDRFGRCHACADALSLAQLQEVPWADGCRVHG